MIGSHIVDELIARDDTVSIIDNLSTGSLDNIRKHSHSKNIKVYCTNADSSIAHHVKNADVVIHLAASVGVENILNKPLESILNNINTTDNVLSLCHLYNKKVLIASTSEVYGKQTGILKETNDCVIGPVSKIRWSYAASKLTDEFLARSYHLQGCKVWIVRFFNIVGPRQVGTHGMVIPRMIDSALNNKDIVIYGNGSQTRCFTHVKDTSLVVLDLLNHVEATGFPINIGSTEEISILDLANRIKSLTSSKSNIIFSPHKNIKEFDDMQRRVPDVSLLRSIIGYSPQTPLDTILKDTIEWIKKN